MFLQSERLSPANTAKFAILVGFAAIFFDASVGHGLTWQNDPYWTYWITKTFLITTVFGLGTAWFGIGVGRGALITAVHTLVLTVYYWTVSPIGLPSTPNWLDLEHTWISGVPNHFAVIYIGYLLALWAWRQRWYGSPIPDSAALGGRALAFGLAIVVIAGGLASLALGDFPGVTWFVVRLLITVTFLLVWWGVFRTDALTGVIGAVLMALVWATYGQYLGPSGLPDRPLRILAEGPPPASAEWLSYRDLWLISLPIYLAVMIVAMAIPAGRAARPRPAPLTLVALAPVVLLVIALVVSDDEDGVSATFTGSGNVSVEGVGAGAGDIRIDAVDMGNRVSPLPPHDRLLVDATFNAGGQTYAVSVRQAMIEDPLGEETTWWGVGLDVRYREEDGETFTAEVIGYGFGDLTVDGTLVAQGVPVEVLASHHDDYGLTLEIGSDVTPIPGVGDGTMTATWSAFSGDAPQDASTRRYIGGGILLLGFIAAGIILNRREDTVSAEEAIGP